MNLQKTWALIIGGIFLLIGVVGLFTNAFPIPTTHDGIHIISGLIFIWAALKGPTKKVNQWFGVTYVLIGILGFAGLIEFIGVDLAINVYHLVVAGGISALIGFLAK